MSQTHPPTQNYGVVATEWGSRTVIIVKANSTSSAIRIAKQNVGRTVGWEGISKIHSAYAIHN